MRSKCGICSVSLTQGNICGGGIYPPDCQKCGEFMCTKCCIIPNIDDPSVAYCEKCFKNVSACNDPMPLPSPYPLM